MAWAYILPIIMNLLESQDGQQGSSGSGSGSGIPFGNNNNFALGGGGGGGGGSMGGGGGGVMSSLMSMFGNMGGGRGGGGGGGGGGLMNSLMSQTPSGRMGGIANGIFNMFFAKNPSDSARPDLQAIEGSMGKYLNPYIDAGKSAMGTLQDQYGQLINNPGAVMNKIGAGFQQSPGYKFQTDQALGSANRAAAASGMAGSPQEQMQLAGTVNGLANQDYYNYLNHGIGMYDQGLSGTSHIFDTGFNASGMMSQGVMQALMAMAQNDYAGANTYNEQMGGGIGSIIGGLT